MSKDADPNRPPVPRVTPRPEDAAALERKTAALTYRPRRGFLLSSRSKP